VQLLFPRLGGGKVALREYMIFDDRTRALFMRRPSHEWPGLARRMMDENKVQSKKMVTSAWEALERGDISFAVYKEIVKSERNLR